MEFLGALIALAAIGFFFYVVIWPFIEIGVDVSKSSRHQRKIKKAQSLQEQFPDAFKEWFGSRYVPGLSDDELDKILSHSEWEWTSKQQAIDAEFERQKKEIEFRNERVNKVNDLCSKYPHAYRSILGKPPVTKRSETSISSLRYLKEVVASDPGVASMFNTSLPYEPAKPRRALPERVRCSYSLTDNEITTLLNTPEDKLKEVENQIVDELKKREEEIDKKYSEIESRYPNGLRLYSKKHPDTSSKERIVSLSREIFESYEENYRIAQYYSQWHDSQVKFAKEMRDLRDSKLDGWGCYCYNAQVQGRDEYGNSKSFDFKIWQLFCESFCTSQNCDYTYYPHCKTNSDKIPAFINKTRSFNKWVYDKIIDFIEAIPGKVLINFADSGLGDTWDAIEYYHFGYIKQMLNLKNIPFTSCDHLPPNHTLHCGPVVFIELISNNNRLQETCSHFLQTSSGDNLTVVYLSLLKEFDENELLTLNRRKEKEIREATEKAQREKEEQERREKEEAERKAREEREAEERKKREEEAQKAREEQQRLYSLSHSLKPNSAAFKNHLTSNGVRYFYHFTDRRNLESIKKHGGLFSWRYCEDHDINIPYPGGDNTSRSLDSRHRLSDYVRLSFCTDHPMKWVLEQKGYDMVLLRVKIDVACLEGTLFSDINATDNNHHHGGSIEDLKRINIPATQQNYVSRESEIFKQHQAEVMVKTFIPLEYIEMPDSLPRKRIINDDLPF